MLKAQDVAMLLCYPTSTFESSPSIATVRTANLNVLDALGLVALCEITRRVLATSNLGFAKFVSDTNRAGLVPVAAMKQSQVLNLTQTYAFSLRSPASFDSVNRDKVNDMLSHSSRHALHWTFATEITPSDRSRPRAFKFRSMSGFGSITIGPTVKWTSYCIDWTRMTPLDAKQKSIRWCANEMCNLTSPKLLMCSSCRAVCYCSPQCAKTKWRQHQADCKYISASVL